MIKDVGEVVTGNTPPKKNPENYGGSLPWIKPPDLNNGVYVSSSEETISEQGRQKVRILPKGSVLVSCIGNIGKIAVADCELCTNQQINSIIPNKEIADSIFLYYTMKRMQPVLESIASSAVVPLLNKSNFSKIEIPLPPLPVQQKIVAVLEKAEQLKEWRREADGLTDEYLRSVFMEMFGDPVRNEKGWEIENLGKCVEFITSGSRGWAQYYTSEGERFIRIQNVKNGILNFTDVQFVQPPNTQEAIRTKVRENDLLISITADLGRTAVVDEKTAKEGAYINQHLALLRLNMTRLNPIFVSSFLEGRGGKIQFSMLDQKGVKSGLNFKSINSLRVPVPPLPLQQKFAAIVEQTEKIREQQAQSRQYIDALFESLMQQAFRGELQ